MKRLSILILSLCAIFCINTTAISVNAQSLDDIVSAQQEQIEENEQSEQNEQSDSTESSADSDGSGEGILGGIEGAPQPTDESILDSLNPDFTQTIDGVQPVVSWINYAAGWVLQILFALITALLVIRFILDLAYLYIPMIRSLLDGNRGTQAEMGNVNIAGNGMNNGGYANGGYGNGQYGNNMYNNGAYGNGVNRGQMPSRRRQWVSTKAIKAAAQEGTVDPSTGKKVSIGGVYVKDMAVSLVLVPVCIVLLASGVVMDIGFALGNVVHDWLVGISNSL